MNKSIIFFSLHVIIILSMPLFVFSLRTGLSPLRSDPCNHPPPDPRILRPDQMTVLINGYSEHRIPLLHSIAATYAAASSVASVIILWSNLSTPPHILSDLSQNLSVTVLRQPSSSLNLRFYPHQSITTRAVLISDDDVEPDPDSINFAFNLWKSDPDRLIGFFVRSHSYDLNLKSWIYTMENAKYSIVLTKLMILSFNYLYKYTCNEEYAQLRIKVEEMNNCEDILMNFVVAEEVKKGPILVGAKKGVRDWGDARNEGEGREEREVGLSSRKGKHRKRRGECIGEFHRLLGKMPLRYSYGKVTDAIGEQGLCEKGAAEEVKRGLKLVGAKRGKVRNWGDVRNEGEGMEEREVGLSSRKGEHRKRIGECIGEFHRLLGKMPLRYSYGKVMEATGKQGLCEKGGRLVYCDKQIFK